MTMPNPLIPTTTINWIKFAFIILGFLLTVILYITIENVWVYDLFVSKDTQYKEFLDESTEK